MKSIQGGGWLPGEESSLHSFITYEEFQLYGYSSLLKQSETDTTPPSAKTKYIIFGLETKQSHLNKQRYTETPTKRTKEAETRGYDLHDLTSLGG